MGRRRKARPTLSLAIFIALITIRLCAQTLDELAVTVVYLHGSQVSARQSQAGDCTCRTQVSATGFLVTTDGANMFLVTAEHVAAVLKSDFRATLRGTSDTPIDVSSEELTGTKNVIWVSHGKEDVAVTILRPAEKIVSNMTGRFMQRALISSDRDAPSRERPLTTLGFPLGLGVQEHFSPISRDSLPVSGLLTLPRFDTHTPANFYLLDNPSIAGFSGAPVFLFPKPYTSGAALAFPDPTKFPLKCVGLVHGTIYDDTGGKMAAITPSVYILETIDKAIPSTTVPR